MENQDKIYQEFKEAAAKAETKGFDRMEAVWNRVEEKLDEKNKRRPVLYIKYGSVAALLLLCLTVGTFIFRKNNSQPVAPKALPENNVTVIDTQKVKEAFDPEKVERVEEVVVNEKAVKPLYDEPRKKVVVDSIPFATVSKKARIWVDNKYSGIVNDSQGPLPGATVIVNNSKANVQTDMDGKFTINAKKGDTINVEYLGYKSQKTVLGDNAVAIFMEEDVKELENVQLNVYRRTPISKAPYAVASTTTEKINKRANKKQSVTVVEDRANANVLQSLQGQVAGMNINSGSTAPGTAQSYVQTDLQKGYSGNTKIVLKGKAIAEQSGYIDYTKDKNYDILANGRLADRALPGSIAQGQPGSDSTIIIRGVGSVKNKNRPAFIVNGEIIDEKDFENMDADHIETISVLKDEAATSIYGNRASNGAIIIQTKGKETGKALKKLFKKDSNKELISEKPTSRFIPIDTEEYESFEENKFENPATAPLSTFSIDVDNASYTNVRRFLNNGQTVPKDAVRVEEMINFFKYKYNQPTLGTPFSLNTELSDAPWNPKHKLLKIGLQGKDIPQAELAASNFVFLIDVSGSMNDPNKLPLLKQSMKLLVNQMREQDRIAIVVYAGAAGLVLPSTGGAEKSKIIAALDNLSAGGSTAGGAGIELAYKTAQEHFIKGGNNRVILATDGDFNVGASSNTDMQTLIEEKRKSGVFLTCLGYGMGNYKDSKMEILADKGNGNYAYIDNMQEATRFLDKEFKGSMYAIAKDVKIQIEFNPKHVQSYRLIGYENRKLRDEDFANDAVDAGELGSGHTVTALYEIIPVGVQSDYFNAAPDLKYSTPQTATGNYADELATIKFRYKKPDEDKSKEIVKVIPNVAVPLNLATPDFKFATSVAWFGLKLRDSKLIPNKETEAIKKLASEGLQNDPEGYRAEFVRLVDMVK